MHLVVRYPGYIMGGVDSVTFPIMGATGGQYVENTLKVLKKRKQRLANFNIFLRGSNLLF